MVQVEIIAELEEDGNDPAVVYSEVFCLPHSFAGTAPEALAKIAAALARDGYVELPQEDSIGRVPISLGTVRTFAVWEAS